MYPNRVLLSGYYGFRNLGDELLLRYISKIFKDEFNCDVVCATGDVAFSKTLFKDINFIYRNDFDTLAKQIKNVDVVALGGGGLFQDYDRIEVSNLFLNPNNGVQSYVNIPLLAKIYKKSVYYLFQGVGPFFSPDAKCFAEFAYSLADFISVRDRKSYQILSEMGFKDILLSADPVLLYPRNIKKNGVSKKPKVGGFAEKMVF